MGFTLIAGSISSALFIASTIPALSKVLRTKDMHSYSRSSLSIATIGNLIHWFYIFSLPFGPIYALHAFATLTTGLMLLWFVRYERRYRAPTIPRVILRSPYHQQSFLYEIYVLRDCDALSDTHACAETNSMQQE